MIKLKNLSCKFDEKTILQNINLNLQGHLNILGANGSGKSTLAKCICGLIEYDGEIEINTTNIKELSLTDRAKTISYIPAKLEIYDQYISLEEFVLLGRFPHKNNFFDYAEKDRNIVKQTLEFLHISHLAYHTMDSLSSGEQQLSLIAQALSQQSKIIIFDEPTANLDPKNSKIIAQHIKGLKEYHQIILITHDIHLASFIDSPILFIKNQTAQVFENDFFKDDNLEELYGVGFNSMVIKYD